MKTWTLLCESRGSRATFIVAVHPGFAVDVQSKLVHDLNEM